ncbi:MAG: hypothetical protein ABI612_03510, partial [Betaproteobacteria bacterium]
MSLLTIWKANPMEIEIKLIQQLVAIAGDGVLKDEGNASTEVREFLGAVPTGLLGRYLDQCLNAGFQDSGFVLQDIVNELGRRLGCEVKPGIYRGKVGAVGFDGIWTFPDGYCIVVESKTTDAYSIKLDKFAAYRSSLIKQAALPEQSSILIVVGRADTDGLEAQVRGSRHAWDIRLISADKLLKLVEIKQAADSKATIQKIRTVLTPLELTRVDFIVDLLATTAEDIKDTAVAEAVDEETEAEVAAGKKWTPVAFHDDVVARVAEKLGTEFKKETRSLYASING